MRHMSASDRAVKLVNWSNTGQLVKVSNQFLSKLQKGQIRGTELEIGQELSCQLIK